MQQYGKASVYGVDGAIAYGGTAIAAVIQDCESSMPAEIDEFRNGLNQLLGFNVSGKQLVVDLTIVPTTGATNTEAAALQALQFPAEIAKITLSGMKATDPDVVLLNGDYIYRADNPARRTVVRGQAAMRMTISRPLDLASGVTVTTLTTAVSG